MSNMDHYDIAPETRKYHFWRGFRTACIVFVPIILVLVYFLNMALNAMLAA